MARKGITIEVAPGPRAEDVQLPLMEELIQLVFRSVDFVHLKTSSIVGEGSFSLISTRPVIGNDESTAPARAR